MQAPEYDHINGSNTISTDQMIFQDRLLSNESCPSQAAPKSPITSILPYDDIELPKLVFIPRRFHPYNKNRGISDECQFPTVKEKARVQHIAEHNLKLAEQDNTCDVVRQEGAEEGRKGESTACTHPQTPHNKDKTDCLHHDQSQTSGSAPPTEAEAKQPNTAEAPFCEPVIFPITNVNILSKIIQEMDVTNPYETRANKQPVNYYNIKRKYSLPPEYRAYEPAAPMSPSSHPMNSRKRLGNGQIYDREFKLHKKVPTVVHSVRKSLLHTPKRLGNADTYDVCAHLRKPSLKFVIPRMPLNRRGNRDSSNAVPMSRESLPNASHLISSHNTERRLADNQRDVRSCETMLTYTAPTCSLKAQKRPYDTERYDRDWTPHTSYAGAQSMGNYMPPSVRPGRYPGFS